MKKNYLLKSLFVAVALAMGSMGAWASETATATVHMTYVNYDKPTTSYGEIAAGSTAESGYNKISGGSVSFPNTSWNVHCMTYLLVDSSAIDGTITGATLTADCSGSTDGKRVTTWGIGYNSSTWASDMTYTSADKTITTIGATATTANKSASVFSNLSFDISNALTSDADKIVTLLVYETAAGGGYIKNPVVTITYTPKGASTAAYTVKYLDESNTEIKTSDAKRTGEVGRYASLTDADKATFYNSDNSKKYVYSSDNASTTTIASDGSSVINVIFKTYEPYTYTLTAQYGEGGETETLGTGSTDGDLTATVYYPYCKLYNGTYYTIDANASAPSYGYTLSSSEKTKTLVYTANTNITYYSEFESLGTTLYNGVFFQSTASNGDAHSFNKGTGNVTTAMGLTTGGYYDVTVRCGDRNGKSQSKVLYLTDGTTDTEIGTLTTTSSLQNDVIKGVYIKAGQELKIIHDDATYVSTFAGDYILVTPATMEPITISSSGYATYCSDYALDFSGVTGLTAYKATAYSSNVLTLAQVQNAPAGQGLILKGTASTTYSVPVTSSATAITDNKLQGTTAAYTVSTDNIYALAIKSNIVGFYKVNTGMEIHKGKAYYVLTSEAKADCISFNIDGDVTGINEINSNATVSDGSYYTIQGIKVMKPVKGLYIHNGKKEVIK